ncbi:SRPBCC family protein [Sinomonas sp. ASV486]|uniref:SRPBCC family protein n=1 Tax=Sinomonas puerhi TaxID=3238584 RepID=A0AB39L3I5_9MICC|nr:SRPBCC family protein [Sinomonas sp. ASV486]MDQ4488921.1 SRPBCC family protein [Sinomonas sp. ASV486]
MYSGHITIAHDAAPILSVLTETSRIAAWNPAFSSFEGSGPAVLGHPYRVMVRGIAKAVLHYTQLDPNSVRYTISGMGSTEEGEWTLESADGETAVTHTFKHSGPILMLMQPAFTHVADWRLERLRDEVERASAVGGATS